MLDILCRLFSRNTQILAQSKRTDSIHNAEINCFCISSLQICHFIKWYMEYLGSCHSVNISRFTICLDQLFITGTMRQNLRTYVQGLSARSENNPHPQRHSLLLVQILYGSDVQAPYEPVYSADSVLYC